MTSTGLKSGMGQLLVGGVDLGAVYYEIHGRKRSSVARYSGSLSGDPAVLQRAAEEREATLRVSNGIEVPVLVTKVYVAEGSALVDVNAEIPGLADD